MRILDQRRRGRVPRPLGVTLLLLVAVAVMVPHLDAQDAPRAAGVQTGGSAKPCDGWGPERNGLRTRLVPSQKEYVVGRPARFRLEMKNVGQHERTYDAQQVDVNDSFRINDPDRKALRYVGGSFQTFGRETSLSPGKTVVLFDELDLATLYLFVKPGSYTLRFRGDDIPWHGESPIPASNEIAVAFRPGELPASVQVPARLVEILPEGWHVSLNWRVAEPGVDKIAPPGWATGRGTFVELVAYLGPYKSDGVRIKLWVAESRLARKEKSPTEAATKHGEVADYVGKGVDGHVYWTVPEKAEAQWPDLRTDVKTALRIAPVASAPGTSR